MRYTISNQGVDCQIYSVPAIHLAITAAKATFLFSVDRLRKKRRAFLSPGSCSARLLSIDSLCRSAAKALMGRSAHTRARLVARREQPWK